MTPIENEHSPDEQKSGVARSHRKHRRRHRKHRKTFWQRFTKTFKTNPLKILSPFFLGVLVFLSFLFFVYDDGDKTIIEDEKFLKRNDLVNGILLSPNTLETKAIRVDLGGRGSNISKDSSGVLISLEKMRQGYAISPLNFITCGNEGIVGDSSKFILSLDRNRLYVNADFKNIFTDELAGSIDKRHWTFLSKNISQFYSDDNLFEVLDSQGYVIFSMQFIQPDKLSIRGYFAGERCIYIAADNGLSAQPKEGNYIEKASEQIRNIKRIYNSK